MSATLTKPELAATPPANASAIRPCRITVAAAVAALREVLSLPHGVEDPLVIAGHSNKEIAAALFVSPNTIKTHVTSLLNKLDADNRAHLAVIAMQCGLFAH